MSRRNFIKSLACIPMAASAVGAGIYAYDVSQNASEDPDQLNPWIELSRAAYAHNINSIMQMSAGKPILAVLKNNAYGLGDVEVAKILDSHPHIYGFALVKEERCLALRKSGIKKPILLMGDFKKNSGVDLLRHNITLSVFSKASSQEILNLARQYKKQINTQLYFDTGLGRMGIPYFSNIEWIQDLSAHQHINIEGVYATLTTPKDFVDEQIQRFEKLIPRLKHLGVRPTHLHLAPSYSILQSHATHYYMVRPGILLHGSFPLVDMRAAEKYHLIPTFRLRARVIRLEKLRKGDTIGFSRFYTLKEDEWIATIPIGWADGYNAAAENGAQVLIDHKLYTVVNVNASHCNVCIGKQKEIKIGAVATLIGPDRTEITPEGFAKSIKGNNYLQINYKESLPKIVRDDFNS